MSRRHLSLACLAAASCAGLATSAHAINLGPDFVGSYTINDLGAVPSLPTSYGGLTLLPSDPNTLLIGGAANGTSGQLFTIGVTRDGMGHINGFTGSAVAAISAQYNDGGVSFGPGGVLFASRWPVNELGQYKPGSTTPDKVINMAALGVAQSHAAINFVPAGFADAGGMRLVSYGGGQFYDAAFSPDGSGTFNIDSLTQVASLPGGPEGFVWVTGGAGFTGPSFLLSEYAAGQVAAYDIDANSNPIAATRRPFLEGLTGAEGAFVDPLTGDFLFSTFGSINHVVVVSGFDVPFQAPTVIDQAVNGMPGDLFNVDMDALDGDTDQVDLTWSLDGFTGPGLPTFDTATGQFSWDSTGAAPGVYTATFTVTDPQSLSDTGTLSIALQGTPAVPEPASAALAFLGLAGLALRRR